MVRLSRALEDFKSSGRTSPPLPTQLFHRPYFYYYYSLRAPRVTLSTRSSCFSRFRSGKLVRKRKKRGGVKNKDREKERERERERERGRSRRIQTKGTRRDTREKERERRVLHRVPEYFESTRCIVTRAYPWSTLSTIRNQPPVTQGEGSCTCRELTARWPSCVPIHGVVYSIRSSQTIQPTIEKLFILRFINIGRVYRHGSFPKSIPTIYLSTEALLLLY